MIKRSHQNIDIDTPMLLEGEGSCIEPPAVVNKKEPLTINDKPTITVTIQHTPNIANHEQAYFQSDTLM